MVIGFLSAAAPADAVVNTGTIIPSPSPHFANNILWSVSCVSSTWCMSAGWSAGDNLFIELANGTVSEVTDPNPSYAKVLGVSCVSDTRCIAVGYQIGVNFNFEKQILSFDGAAWTPIQLSNFGSGDNSLESVSCASSTSCVAVGFYNSGRQPYSAASQTLAMIWDGANWTQEIPPNTGSGDNHLTSVSCTSSTSCVAVGFSNSGLEPNATSTALAMTWDGANWTQVTPPNTGSGDNMLTSVSCTSATSCIAVGEYNDGSNLQALALKWEGTSWSTISAPVGTGDSSLSAVSCVSSTVCVAVGQSLTTTGLIPLMASWDGSNWTVFAGPTSPDGEIYPYAISCTSENLCLVSGQVGYPAQSLLIELTESAAPTTTTTASQEPLAPSFTG